MGEANAHERDENNHEDQDNITPDEENKDIYVKGDDFKTAVASSAVAGPSQDLTGGSLMEAQANKIQD